MCHALEKPRKNSPKKNVHVTTKRSTGTTKRTKKGDLNSKRSIEKARDSANSLVSVHILSDVLDEDNLELSDQDSTAGREKDSTTYRCKATPNWYVLGMKCTSCILFILCLLHVHRVTIFNKEYEA